MTLMPRTSDLTPTDVVVVGAGYAGLSAALALADAGRSVRVIEAAAEVGGRTAGGLTADGQWLELGGQWVAEAHTELRALIGRFGLATEPTGQPGRLVSLAGGERREHDANDRRETLTEADREAVAVMAAAFAAIVGSVDMKAPWRTPDAALLDEITFAAWIRDQLPSESARTFFVASCDAIFAPDPLEVSLLHAAYYFRSGDHLARLFEGDRESQEERVVGGASVVCNAIATHLGDRVIVGAPVRGIRHHAAGVEVILRDGGVSRAGRAIVTLPPALAGRLDYTPPLPSVRDQLTQRMHAIATVKMYLVYDRAFWRDADLSGEAVVDDGPIRVVLDNTPGGYPGGVLVAFIEGADKLGVGLADPASRRTAFIDLAVRLFGELARRPVEYLERDWAAEEFSRGCYGGHLSPGTWVGYGAALTAPVGRIHWAGTETSAEWTGYMEGAIRSGRRAAAEVIECLEQCEAATPEESR